MSNDTPKDPFGIEAAMKQIAEAFNEGVEQAKLQRECKIRRFFRSNRVTNENDALGIVFPDGTTVVQEYVSGNIHIYDGINRVKTSGHRVTWIDPEVTP